MNNILEICTDASLRTFDNGRAFGCSGAICINNEEIKYLISQDSTNNRSELLGIYLGCQLAKDIIIKYPKQFNEIILYSDSQFGIFGLRKWMDGWLKTTDNNGIMYGSNMHPVKNQELFKAIITFLVINNLHINFRHQAGHIRYSNLASLQEANEVFYKSNGYRLKQDEIYKISYYNDTIDKYTRSKLQTIDPDNYPIINRKTVYNTLCKYIIPKNYKEYAL